MTFSPYRPALLSHISEERQKRLFFLLCILALMFLNKSMYLVVSEARDCGRRSSGHQGEALHRKRFPLCQETGRDSGKQSKGNQLMLTSDFDYVDMLTLTLNLTLTLVFSN